jgi:hypothetical protein
MPEEDCPGIYSDENDYEKDRANNDWSTFILWTSLEPVNESHAETPNRGTAASSVSPSTAVQ